jgi:putative transcriptional regulator
MKKYQPTSPLDNDIAAILIRKNLSQADLARACGLKREYINRIVNRKISPGGVIMLNIAKALGVPVEEIFWVA